jgi:hypothetical protein
VRRVTSCIVGHVNAPFFCELLHRVAVRVCIVSDDLSHIKANTSRSCMSHASYTRHIRWQRHQQQHQRLCQENVADSSIHHSCVISHLTCQIRPVLLNTLQSVPLSYNHKMRTHAYTHTHTHTVSLSLSLAFSVSVSLTNDCNLLAYRFLVPQHINVGQHFGMLATFNFKFARHHSCAR